MIKLNYYLLNNFMYPSVIILLSVWVGFMLPTWLELLGGAHCH